MSRSWCSKRAQPGGLKEPPPTPTPPQPLHTHLEVVVLEARAQPDGRPQLHHVVVALVLDHLVRLAHRRAAHRHGQREGVARVRTPAVCAVAVAGRTPRRRRLLSPRPRVRGMQLGRHPSHVAAAVLGAIKAVRSGPWGGPCASLSERTRQGAQRGACGASPRSLAHAARPPSSSSKALPLGKCVRVACCL